MESDGRTGNILNFRQVRHVRNSAPGNDAWHLLAERHLGCQKYLRLRTSSVMTTIMLFRIMIMIAVVIMTVMMMVSVG